MKMVAVDMPLIISKINKKYEISGSFNIGKST